MDPLFRSDFGAMVRARAVLTGDWGPAADAVQHGFAQVHRHGPGVSRLEKPAAWTKYAAITGVDINGDDRPAWAPSLRVFRDVTGNNDGHRQLNANNDYCERIGSVPERHNGAVGWNRWRPDELDGAAVALDDLADGEPMYEEDVRSAADFVRRAEASDDHDSAIAGRRLVQRVDRALDRG